jgi:ferric-dicitrate binding protein FerR (iron transport regulator)
MNQNRVDYLLKQYATGHLTGEEHQELVQLLSQTDRDELAQYIASLAQHNNFPPSTIPDKTANDTFNNIIAADKAHTSAINIPWRINYRWLSAATLLLIATTAIIYFTVSRKTGTAPITQATIVKPEKQAGRNTAILTLADNSTITLDSAANGQLTQQGISQVIKTENGELVYEQAVRNPGTPLTTHHSPLAYNTLRTPRGGEYTILLPDGTRVWLNAASSLKFPTAFTGDKRTVELTGEAYLDVAEDKAHPFEVKIGQVNVAVHGTEFNIMGYDDEQRIVTTLVAGKVTIATAGNTPQTLSPGEHAVIKNNDTKLYIEKADVDEETAWKNGRTYFNGANIQRIMRQVARWYDVDVEYNGNVTNLDFTCTVSRKDKLSKLLALMELTGAVHFTMKGNTIIVQP